MATGCIVYGYKEVGIGRWIDDEAMDVFRDKGEGWHGLGHPQLLASLGYCRGCSRQIFCFSISVPSNSTFICFWNTTRAPISEAQSPCQMLERNEEIGVQKAERTENINWGPHVIAERWWQQGGRRRGKYGQLGLKSSVSEKTEFLSLSNWEEVGAGDCVGRSTVAASMCMCYDLINNTGILKDWNSLKERIHTLELQRAFVFCVWNCVPSKDKLLSRHTESDISWETGYSGCYYFKLNYNGVWQSLNKAELTPL